MFYFVLFSILTNKNNKIYYIHYLLKLQNSVTHNGTFYIQAYPSTALAFGLKHHFHFHFPLFLEKGNLLWNINYNFQVRRVTARIATMVDGEHQGTDHGKHCSIFHLVPFDGISAWKKYCQIFCTSKDLGAYVSHQRINEGEPAA